MKMSEIECPYCGKKIDYCDIMGDSDWDDQQDTPYHCGCSHCDKEIIITQIDWYVVRGFHVEGEKQSETDN